MHSKQSDKGDLYACGLGRSRSLKRKLPTMSTPDIATSRTVLDELRKPWSATTLTETQEQRRSDVASAKILWSQVLVEFRQKQGMTVKNYNLRRKRQPFFQFLDLPGELRNMI